MATYCSIGIKEEDEESQQEVVYIILFIASIKVGVKSVLGKRSLK